MKRILFIIALTLAAAFVLGTTAVHSQSDRSDYRTGTGMMGGYSGAGMGPGMMGGWVEVPAKLSAPKNMEWIAKLQEILALEKQSLAQYQTDQEKFNAYMPYMMVIPQEENHIEWIRQLFEAYGLTADGKTGSVVENKTLNESYKLSVKMEDELLPRYEWLIKKAEDRTAAEVLNAVLIQSRWHLVMFEHALRMGHGYGYSRGVGMMGGYGSGMMGQDGSGNGMGRGYGRQSWSTGKPMDEKEAESMMDDYLKSTRNPNLKLGKIKDAGEFFETEILTNKNDLVDRIIIDKKSGSVRSAY